MFGISTKDTHLVKRKKQLSLSNFFLGKYKRKTFVQHVRLLSVKEKSSTCANKSYWKEFTHGLFWIERGQWTRGNDFFGPFELGYGWLEALLYF